MQQHIKLDTPDSLFSLLEQLVSDLNKTDEPTETANTEKEEQSTTITTKKVPVIEALINRQLDKHFNENTFPDLEEAQAISLLNSILKDWN